MTLHLGPTDAENTETVDPETGEISNQPLPGFQLDTLVGDLRDALLMRLRAMPKPYTVMSEMEQQDLIDGCTRAATHLVTQAVTLIAANGMPTMSATLEQITIKDGAKLQLTASRHDRQLHDFIDAAGLRVILSLADPARYGGERAPATPDPDQPELPTDDGFDDNVAAFKGRDNSDDGT